MSEPHSSFPEHGRVACSKCFPGPTVWNETDLLVDGWHVVNNPMSWGTATPRFLLLGVSKGTTQCDAIAAKPHDEVPFDGFRPTLTRALQTLGLLRSAEAIDEKISAAEQEWGFGSMVRCALGLPKADDSIERSGTVVQRLAAMPIEGSWITRCSSTFLRVLPPSLRVVVLLSNDDKYIKACFTAIRRLRAGTRRINAVSYGDEQITWVHIVHVGGPGKNHINSWFDGAGTQGSKRKNAQAAVRRALGQTVEDASEIAPSAPARSPTEVRASRKSSPKPEVAGKPIPPNPIRDAILTAMTGHRMFVAHPAETKAGGTKYVSAFRSGNGRAIAFNKAVATKQPIWLKDEAPVRELLDRLGVPFDYYPADKGRNSNLNKLAEFEGQSLVRAFPQTHAEAMAVVGGVALLPAK